MEIATAIDVFIGGILSGGIYALIALGLTVVFGVTRLLNVAHGDFLMLGALLTYTVVMLTNVDAFLTLGLSLPLFFVIGAALYSILNRPATTKTADMALRVSIIVTLGLSMMMEDMSAFVLAPFGVQNFGLSYPLPPLVFGGFLPISSIRLLGLIIIVAVSITLHVFLRYTLPGKMIRAVIENRLAAIAIGINATRISAIGVGIGTSLAGMSGFVMGLILPLTPYAGLPLTVKALAIIVLGGMGSFLGAVVGGIVLGVVEAYIQYFVGADWPPTVSLFILIAVLLIRPRGLFGQR